MLTLVTLIKIGYYWRGFPINFAEYFRTAILQNICERMLLILSWSFYRSNHQRCSMRKGVLRNFAKFTGKHLCQSLFFCRLRPATLLKRDSGTGFFLWILGNFSEQLFLQNTSRRLLLQRNIWKMEIYWPTPSHFSFDSYWL